MTRREAKLFRNKLNSVLSILDDESASDSIILFPKWAEDINYDVGSRVNYNDALYKCILAHTSQFDWNPESAVSLWVRISIEEWPEWVQPVGSQDAYSSGDKVIHNESKWISDCDNNVWEPGVYGWTEA